MDMIFDIKGNVLVAEMFGELDHHAAQKVRADIDNTMETYGATELLFDFTKVTFMDSAGIGVILGRYRKLSVAGGKAAITGCSQTMRSILNMAGVFSLVDYFDRADEAIRYLRKETR